ncbi:hypothetical protein [Pseudonocardia sp. MH-G8]|uniref:hypothetical protein n=1 Tax=Pseudonocardia sp. MH-G8 TaxID=1854588 RepID=UPI000BA15B30|nr:hypothetical protein [Pseudonocardia sp. MH-G8]OZM76374.1 hypothetical protein CFP66_41275 [Pseudonocardia sp. MH-G8]
MESLLYGVAILACPVGMGLMMWMMMRGNRNGGGSSGKGGGSEQVAQLRAEIEQLKVDRATQRTPKGL